LRRSGMARACIDNIENISVPLLEKLRADGRIVRWEQVLGAPMLCFDFNGHLELSITDLMDVAAGDIIHGGKPDYSASRMAFLQDVFKKHILLKIANTLRGGIIHGFTDTWIELESTDKTMLVCFRVTPAEKKQLEQQAAEQNQTLSEYIRQKLGL